MSDYLLDFRQKRERAVSKASGFFRYYDDISVKEYNYEEFSMVLSRPDDWNLWGPYESKDNEIFVAVCGRIALESKDWDEAKTVPGDGGVASKAIYKIYKSGRLSDLENLNGNFSVFIYDAYLRKFIIIFDRCGMFPGYFTDYRDGSFVYCSHPDVLAKYLGYSTEFDLVSLAEFIVTGKLSHPNTYYEKIKSVEYGTVHLFNSNLTRLERRSVRKYFEFNFAIDCNRTEWDLAEELASSFGNAVNRRTLSLFGQTAISLSGGLDSRTMLCSVENKQEIKTFCFYDEENIEYRIAKKIAKETGVDFFPMKREFEHYGDNAEMGVMISGGMGDFVNNHYLGFRNMLNEHGIKNIVAGFYCDYLFKGLVLDKISNRYLRYNKYSDFKYDNYAPIFWLPTEFSDYVRDRLNIVFPEELKINQSDNGKLIRENRRIFPLCYEPDNMETLVPQRVMGWYLPIVDNDILNTYLKIPPEYKLNNSIYPKMVKIQCGGKITKIMDVNTYARVGASQFEIIIGGYIKYVSKYLLRLKNKNYSEGSWPNWHYYLCNSNNIKRIWNKKGDLFSGIISKLYGEESLKNNITEFNGLEIKLFMRLMTLKLWLENIENNYSLKYVNRSSKDT